MREKLKALYDLQQLDLDIARAQKAKANLDDGSAKRHQVDAVRQKLKNVGKLCNDSTAELQDHELNLTTVETKQKTFSDKLYGGSVSNPKELESMEAEIEMLGRQKDKLEVRILELMDAIEKRKTTVETVRLSLETHEADLTVLTERIGQESDTLSAKIQELTSQRDRLLPMVDPMLLKRYDAMRVRLGGVAVSQVEGGSCTACHTQITAGLLGSMKTAPELRTCENCSRILYLEK